MVAPQTTPGLSHALCVGAGAVVASLLPPRGRLLALGVAAAGVTAAASVPADDDGPTAADDLARRVSQRFGELIAQCFAGDTEGDMRLCRFEKLRHAVVRVAEVQVQGQAKEFQARLSGVLMEFERRMYGREPRPEIGGALYAVLSDCVMADLLIPSLDTIMAGAMRTLLMTGAACRDHDKAERAGGGGGDLLMETCCEERAEKHTELRNIDGGLRSLQRLRPPPAATLAAAEAGGDLEVTVTVVSRPAQSKVSTSSEEAPEASMSVPELEKHIATLSGSSNEKRRQKCKRILQTKKDEEVAEGAVLVVQGVPVKEGTAASA